MYIMYVTVFSINIKQILLYVHHKTDLSSQNSIATDFFLMQNKSIQTECSIWSFGQCIFGFKFGSSTQYRPSTVHADAEGLWRLPYDKEPSRKRPNSSSSQTWVNCLLMHQISAEALQGVIKSFGVNPLRLARLCSWWGTQTVFCPLNCAYCSADRGCVSWGCVLSFHPH